MSDRVSSSNQNTCDVRRWLPNTHILQEVSEKARELVRYAICNEASRKLLKRDDINKKGTQTPNYRSACLLIDSLT